MKNFLPFRNLDEKNLISSLHPLVRFLMPFIFVIPIISINDIYFTITLFVISIILNLIFRLKLIRTFSKLKSILPFIIIITIFLPLYIGRTVILSINIGIPIFIYHEGVMLALLLFFKMASSAFIFLSFFSSLTYSEFIEALTKIRLIPSFFVGSLVIMLHYIPILATANKKILEAQELRGKNVTTYWKKLKTHAFIMGKSLLNNMERSERLYESMKMRGFNGKITFSSRKIKFLDVVCLFLFIGIVIAFFYFINTELLFKEVLQLLTLLK